MVTVTGKDPAGSTLRSQTLARFLRIAPGSLVALPADRKPQLTTTAHGSTAPSTRPCRTWMSDYDRREGAATGVSKDYPGFLFSTCLLNPPMSNRHRHCQRRRGSFEVSDDGPGFPLSTCRCRHRRGSRRLHRTGQGFCGLPRVPFVAFRRGLTGEVVPYLSGFRSEPADRPGFLVHPSRRRLPGEVAPYLAHPDADDDAESTPT